MDDAVKEKYWDDKQAKKDAFAHLNKTYFRRFLHYFKPPKVLGAFILDSFFAIVIGGVVVGTPFLTQMITRAAKNSDFYELYIGIGALASLVIVQLLASWIVTYWGHLMGTHMEINMRKDIINKMHKFEMSFYDKTPIGSFISRMVSDLRDIPEFAHHAPEDMIIAVVTCGGGFTYAFLQSWIVGLTFTGIFVVGIIVLLIVRIRWRIVWEGVKENSSVMSASIGRQAEGITEIKSFSAEEHEAKMFANVQKKYLALQKRFYKIEGVGNVSSIFIIASSTFLALAAGGILVAKHEIDLPQFVGLTSAAAVINQPINRFVAAYTMLARGGASVNRFFEFMDLPEEKNEGTIIANNIKGEIVFNDVTFWYQDAEGKSIKVLEDFNLHIKRGESIAFVGETGIGKSTILKLLLRFYPIQKGEIWIDGINILDYELKSLRQALCYIQQLPIIFDDTVMNNILYGKPTATDEEIKHAVKSAHVDEFLDKLVNGYDFVVGPRGAKLSGGQRQRLSIARAILANSPILLLDEATSALDNETERKIKDSIELLAKNHTMLVVAHRLSTIKDVDRIIVLAKGGKILEEGTYEKLSKNKGGHLNRLDNIANY